MISLRVIGTIARLELKVNLRNKWIILFAVIFGVLVLGISYFGLITSGAIGFQGFTRTSTSLLNLVLYMVPLVALTMGTLSFTSEKNCGELLFAQPVTRLEIVTGKLIGLFASIASAMLLGFGLAGFVIAARTGNEGLFRYPALVLFSMLLALIFLGLSALASTLCKRKVKAFGIALFLWFFFVIFYDLLIIGGSFLLKERTANLMLFVSLFGNPIDMIRVGTLMLLDGKEVFGAAGAALLRFFGNGAGSALALAAGLTFWIIVPMAITARVLKSQDI
jgi:Cu-processing system permease protein